MKNEFRTDRLVMIVPLVLVALLCVTFMAAPEGSQRILAVLRAFMGDTCGIYYAVLGVGIFLVTMYVAFSKRGDILLGRPGDRPQYSGFQWGSMIFTSTMAADILFYSLCEWMLYAEEPYLKELGSMQKWASTYPLFHWGPIAWCFYIALAAAFGYMLHVKNRDRQKFSEACRPLLGDRIDGAAGKLIDLIAVFALLAGTATTFSLATPLLTAAVAQIAGLPAEAGDSRVLTIAVLLVIAGVYTAAIWFGMKGVQKLAAGCAYLFFALLFYVLFLGGETRYILETGFSALGNMAQNFISMSTWMDPLRENSFPQNWTIYYWAYWMVWCVATPFFIGSISRGRTVRQTILGGYGWGLAGTYTSFIILGNYGMAQQLRHGMDLTGQLAAGSSYSRVILDVLNTLPLPKLAMFLLVIAMTAFYATTFDSITMVVSAYSYKSLPADQEPGRNVRIYWALLFILLPIALLYAGNSMYSLQSVSIIAAAPIGVIIVLIVASFLRDTGKPKEE